MADVITQRTDELEGGLNQLEQTMAARAIAPPAPLTKPTPATTGASGDAMYFPPAAPPEPPIAPTPTAPPTWDEVSSDADYQAQSPVEKVASFARWHDATYNYASSLPDWEQHKAAFNQSAADEEAHLSKEAGGVSPLQARASIAADAINAVQKQTGAPLDRAQIRDVLSGLDTDIRQAYFDHKLADGAENEHDDWDFSEGAGTDIVKAALSTMSQSILGAAKGAVRYVASGLPTDEELKTKYKGQIGVDAVKAIKTKVDGFGDFLNTWREEVPKGLGVEEGTVSTQIGEFAGGLAPYFLALPAAIVTHVGGAYGDTFDHTGSKLSAVGAAALAGVTDLAFMQLAKYTSGVGKGIQNTVGRWAASVSAGTGGNLSVLQLAKAGHAFLDAEPGKRYEAFKTSLAEIAPVDVGIQTAFALLATKHAEARRPKQAKAVADDALGRAATAAEAAASPQLAAKARELQVAAEATTVDRLDQLEKQLGPRKDRVVTFEEQELLQERAKNTPAASPFDAESLVDTRRIVGPVLTDAQGKVLAQGARTHAELMTEAMGGENEVQVLEAFTNDAQHQFVDSDGNILDRKQAMEVARVAGQVKEGVNGTDLHSQNLKPEAAESASAVDRPQFVRRTPEEQKAKEEEGVQFIRDEVAQTGRVPKLAYIRGKTGNNADVARALHEELTAKIAEAHPAEVLPEGAEVTTVKHPITGAELPSVVEAPDAAGVRHVRPQFVNNPEIIGQMFDQGMVSGEKGKRLYIPNDLWDAGQVSPAITEHVKFDAETRQFYVEGVDTKHGLINAPDQYTVAERKAQEFTGRAQKEVVLPPDKLSALNEALRNELDTRGAAEDAITFHEEAEARDADRAAGDLAIKAKGTASPLVQQQNVGEVHSLGLLQKQGDPAITNPAQVGLDAIVTGRNTPEEVRLIAQITKDAGFDLSGIKVTFESVPNGAWAGIYSHIKKEIRLNIGGQHAGGLRATFLHEMFHAVLDGKLEQGAPRNPIEQRAFDNLNRLHDTVSRRLFMEEHGYAATDAQLDAFKLAQKSVNDPGNIGRNFYGLSNLREFVMETLTNPKFQRELASMEASAVAAERPLFRKIIDQIKQAAKEFFAGKVVRPTSMLDHAMNHSLELLKQGPTEAGRFDVVKQAVSPEMLTAEGRVKLADANRRGVERAKTGARAREETGMTADELAGEIEGGTKAAPVLDKVQGDGWVTPAGKFIPIEERMNTAAFRVEGVEAPQFGGHEEAAYRFIQNDPKLATEFEQTAKSKGYQDIREMGVGDIKDFMESRGFLRVMNDGQNMFFTGNPRSNPRGIELLTNHAIESERRLAHDRETSGPNSQQEFYRPPGFDAESFSPILPPTPTTSLQKATETTVKWIKDTTRKLFTAEGNLPKSVFESWQRREGEVKELARDIKYTTRDLYKGVQEAYKISGIEKFAQGFSKLPTEVVTRMNAALLGEKGALDSLPEPVRGPLVEMRAQIDSLSRKLIDDGIVGGELAVKIADNLGVYMTRSYEAFDNPNWPKKVPQDVRNRAEAYVLSELRRDNPAATVEDASRKISAMLQDWSEQGDQGRAGRLGSRDLSSFIKRQDITPVIRELLGEYKDPAINYARSMTKMASLIANTHFLRNVLKQGKEQGFFFEEGKQQAGFDARVAAEGSDAMAPLNGLRTTPAIAEAFKLFGKASVIENPLAIGWMKAVALAKGAKTVGSIMTQVRNLVGQPFFMAMNGHYNYGKLGEAVKMTGADTGLFADTEKWRGEYKKLLKLGVVDQSAKADELRAILKDAAFAPSEEGGFTKGGGVLKAGGTLDKNIYNVTVGAATRLYQVSDDVGKVIGFYNEAARQSKINPDWTPEQVEGEAARRIRLTYPTYSMVPEFIKKLRRGPVGPFMTFGYEAIRTTAHNLNFAAHDIVSENPAARRAGAARIAGQLLVLAGGVGASAVTRALTGTTKKEDDDARLFMAPWDKNAQLAIVGKEKGKLSYINMSYLNPYSFAPDTILAAWNAPKDDLSFVIKAARQFLQPFTSPDILAGAVGDVMTNRRDAFSVLSGAKSGAPIYNSADTFEKKVQAVMTRLFEAVEPGTSARLRPNVLPTEREKDKPVSPVGVGRQTLNELTGGMFKTQTLDFKQAVGFKARDFVQTEKDADSIFRRVALREAATDDDIVEAYNRSEQQRFELWKDMHQVAAAAIRQGLTSTETKTALKARGMTLKDTNRIIRGEYLPGVPTDFLKDALRAQKRKLPTLLSPFKGKSLAVDEVPQG